MNHGDHSGHDMPAMPKCSMHMLWNTDIIDTCIVFRSWHISTKSAFVASCVAIVLLGVLYEWLRVVQRKVDYRIALSLQGKSRAGGRTPRSLSRDSEGRSGPDAGNLEESGLLSGRRLLLNTSFAGTPVPPFSRFLRAALYGLSVFLSFFLMLVFMTYNAYLIAAVVIGATLGNYVFGATMNTDAILADHGFGKGMACH